MKKLIVGLLWLTLFAGSAYAGSTVHPPKPTIQDVLTPDNPSWTGIKYNGIPVKTGSDAIGHNVNYVNQVVVINQSNGSAMVQIYLRAFAPSAYQAGINELNASNSALGFSSYAFQDSGIVMPKSMYKQKMTSPTTLDWSWQIILIYDVPSGIAPAFKTALDSWVVGKLPQTSNAGNSKYYWK